MGADFSVDKGGIWENPMYVSCLVASSHDTILGWHRFSASGGGCGRGGEPMSVPRSLPLWLLPAKREECE